MRLAAWAFLFCLIGLPALAQVAPADSDIKGALYDIERAEKQLPGLTPSRKANIKRLQRSVGMAAERLQRSPNQSHPSWVEANQRLQALQHALSELAAGRTPGAAPAPTTAQPAEQPAEQPAAQPATETATPAAPAAPASDPELAAAQKEIARIAGEVAKLKPTDKALIKRYRTQLDIVATKLKAMPNQSDPAWTSAAQAYNQVIGQLNGLIKQGSTTTAAPAPAPAEGGPAADPNVAAVGRELALIDRQTQDISPNDSRLAARFLKDLWRLEEVLAAAPDKEHEVWKTTEAQHAAIKDRIVGALAVGAAQSLQNTIDLINGMQPTDFMVPDKVADIEKRLNAVANWLNNLRAPEHKTVKIVFQELVKAGKAFEARVETAKAEQSQFGDVAGKMQTIRERHYATKVPQPLRDPVSETDMQAFAQQVAAVRAQIAEDLPWLQSIEGKVPMSTEQGNLYRRLLYEIGGDKPQQLEQALDASDYAVDAGVAEGERMAEWLGGSDPNDFNHQANRLIGEGAFEQNLAKLQRGLEAVQIAAAYDKAVGRKDPPDRAAQEQRMLAAIDDFKQMHSAALGGVRMPEPKSTDQKLLDTAAEVLARPEYGYQFERMVVSYDLHHKEQKAGSISHGTSSSTVTLYHYVWDEYQVTTAEKVGDDYYLFANTLKFYHSGDSTTPTDKWVLSDRFKTIQILAENIHE